MDEDTRKRLEHEFLKEYKILYEPLEDSIIDYIITQVRGNSENNSDIGKIVDNAFDSWKKEQIDKYVEGRANGESPNEAFKKFVESIEELEDYVLKLRVKEHELYGRIENSLKDACKNLNSDGR